MSRAHHKDGKHVELPPTGPETESPGKVVVDSRGHSVWQWAKDVLENTSVLLKRLENKDLALEFLRFVSEPEHATAIYEAGFFREDGTYGIGETSAIVGVEYPEGSNLVASDVELIPELSLFGFGMPPTYDNEDFDQFKYHLENGLYGNRVHEMLVDPQNMANGGNGWIRLLEFDPDGSTVHVKTYSPFLDQWDTSPDNFYDIRLSPIQPGDFNNDGVVDAADYAEWRNGLGVHYTQADYDVWRAHFGEALVGAAAAANSATVPEPTGGLMLLTLGVILCLTCVSHYCSCQPCRVGTALIRCLQ